MNIGLKTGAPSGGTADVDLDCNEAIVAASRLLPPTGLRFGRHSRRSSHHLYDIGGADLRRITYRDPERRGQKATLLELRGEGHQTMAPPSVHPEAEIVEWEAFGQPARIELQNLNSRCARIAAVSLLARYWRDGERHEGALALAGFFIRRGWTEEQTSAFLDVMAEIVGADRPKVRAAVRDTSRRLEQELPATGGHALRQLFPRQVLTSAFRWLGFSSQEAEYSTPAPITSPIASEERSRVEPLTDIFNARLFAKQHSDDVRFVYDSNRWFVYDRGCWSPDSAGEVERRAKQTVESLYGIAGDEPNEDRRREIRKHALKSQDGYRISSLLRLARSEDLIAARRTEFDKDHMLLNCLNGTVDLRSGRLQPHRREDFITRLAPVEFDAEARAPRFDAFLSDIMGGSRELIAYLQRAMGYGSTGDIREHRMFVAYGSGANGKSTLLRAMKRALGTYALSTPVDTLIARRHGGGIPNDVARLAGARFVCAVEAEEDQRLAEEKIKQMTGGDDVTARFLNQEFFEFKPTFKLWLATNHRPHVRGTDEAIWRRIDLVPFSVTIPEVDRDTRLEEKLAEELPGIFAWIVSGALRWQSEGLLSPDAVRSATALYRREEDLLGTFIEDCCSLHLAARTSSADLYEAYRRFCERTGEKYPLSQKRLAPKLRERGLIDGRDSSGRVIWQGVALQPPKGDSWA
jgi:P4 family phage/plasmid primase-like protien